MVDRPCIISACPPINADVCSDHADSRRYDDLNASAGLYMPVVNLGSS
jgi:hypothetical protein